MDNRPIGVFDSGVGGMTVLKELRKKMPHENFVYLGDTKRFPYGSKSKQTIIELTKNAMEFLKKQNVKMIVIACGTATSQALEEVQNLYSIPIIGVIEPTVDYIYKTNKKKIGVMATAGTIRSKGWEKELSKRILELDLQSVACPLLAPMVEEGWYENKIAKLAVKEYIKSFKNREALILGCTLYPLLKEIIQKQLGKKVEVINIGTHVAQEVEKILKKQDMLSQSNQTTLQIYLTETEHKFNEVASILLGENIEAKLVKEETELLV